MVNKIIFFLIISLLLLSCSAEDEQNEINEIAIDISQKEIHACVDISLPDGIVNISRKRGTLYNSSKWADGQIIRIKFLNGSANLQQKVKQYAYHWLVFTNANLIFQFVSNEAIADVKIGFKWNGDITSWSYPGIQCQSIAQNNVSMNFGWFDSNTPEAEIKRTTLHEFGHLLGLMHEHQNPVGDIQWNKPVVYQYYKTSQNWSTEMVDNNIFKKYSVTETNYTNYDKLSIMHYPIDASFTTNGYSVGVNDVFSFTDQAFVSKMYKFPSIMYANQALIDNGRLTSPNGEYTLRVEYSGRLVLYKEGMYLGEIFVPLGGLIYGGSTFLTINGRYLNLSFQNFHWPLNYSYTNTKNLEYIRLNNSGKIEGIVDGVVVFLTDPVTNVKVTY
jgi:serralysin